MTQDTFGDLRSFLHGFEPAHSSVYLKELLLRVPTLTRQERGYAFDVAKGWGIPDFEETLDGFFTHGDVKQLLSKVEWDGEMGRSEFDLYEEGSLSILDTSLWARTAQAYLPFLWALPCVEAAARHIKSYQHVLPVETLAYLDDHMVLYRDALASGSLPPRHFATVGEETLLQGGGPALDNLGLDAAAKSPLTTAFDCVYSCWVVNIVLRYAQLDPELSNLDLDLAVRLGAPGAMRPTEGHPSHAALRRSWTLYILRRVFSKPGPSTSTP